MIPVIDRQPLSVRHGLRFTRPNPIHVVAGAQNGSEGKGMVAGEIARADKDMLSIRVGGPNAGHSVIDSGGRKWALRSLPVGTVVNHGPLAIGPGSEIDLVVLLDEIYETERAGYDTRRRLSIDPEATLIEYRHQMAETNIGTGTTGKGIGAARADRLLRKARRWSDIGDDLLRRDRAMTRPIAEVLESAQSILIEGTQGYGLGTHAGDYPFCTSGDCRVQDFLAQAGIPFQDYRRVIPHLVARVHPIRIAGNSGPLAFETTWEELGLEPEHTTVTHKVRRVGRFEPDRVRAAIHASGGPTAVITLTFLDYLFPQIHGTREPLLTGTSAWEYVQDLSRSIGYDIHQVGTGPQSVAPVS